jgi:hypothetical protein
MVVNGQGGWSGLSIVAGKSLKMTSRSCMPIISQCFVNPRMFASISTIRNVLPILPCGLRLPTSACETCISTPSLRVYEIKAPPLPLRMRVRRLIGRLVPYPAQRPQPWGKPLCFISSPPGAATTGLRASSRAGSWPVAAVAQTMCDSEARQTAACCRRLGLWPRRAASVPLL